MPPLHLQPLAAGSRLLRRLPHRPHRHPQQSHPRLLQPEPRHRIYPHVQAVADGVNVGYDIYRIKTRVSEEGTRLDAGFDYQKRDRLTRTIDPTDLATVTPDAGTKTRFVLVDAVGVTESDKTDSRALERKPTVKFDQLLKNVAIGHRDPGTLTSLANRLADSLPSEKLVLWTKARDAWRSRHPEPLTEDQKAEYYDTFSREIETWLDRGSGSCLLRDPACHASVASALRHFDGERYHLGQHVIAGNHVHALVTPIGDHELSDILHSWKSYTAKELLKLPATTQLETKPKVWQKESYDHIVRSSATLAKIEEYIRAHERLQDTPPLSKTEEDKRRDAASTLANQACKPIAAYPAFCDLLETKRRDREITIDHAWQSVDSDEGVPLAVARKAFGADPKSIIEELNEVLVA